MKNKRYKYYVNHAAWWCYVGGGAMKMTYKKPSRSGGIGMVVDYFFFFSCWRLAIIRQAIKNSGSTQRRLQTMGDATITRI